MQRFTNLKVWQRARELTKSIYELTRSFPADKRFGLTSQLRRAIVSVTANIAEGSKRRRNADFARFLNIAEASLAEVECLLILAQDLNYLPTAGLEPFGRRVQETAAMLDTLRSRVEHDARD